MAIKNAALHGTWKQKTNNCGHSGDRLSHDVFEIYDHNQSINQSINALYSGIFHPYTNYVIEFISTTTAT